MFTQVGLGIMLLTACNNVLSTAVVADCMTSTVRCQLSGLLISEHHYVSLHFTYLWLVNLLRHRCLL